MDEVGQFCLHGQLANSCGHCKMIAERDAARTEAQDYWRSACHWKRKFEAAQRVVEAFRAWKEFDWDATTAVEFHDVSAQAERLRRKCVDMLEAYDSVAACNLPTL